ncbi:T6SS effector amidase Tae4 family protein [Helicobacter sp. MIT 14-3879]|uniref:T6SS effector amidase Tae4 family protein n=1 Tax=Helicobacter sp. MIT 14-3879 TaxID=2040649 RepID=UPI000E1F15D9|nr:T6SS effector amidase Tae4 family protein [Helicobacter sp. MIT 14-3879]RDU60229.1 hypothetical protein CQA44_10705 [Helicobacter sp. MIT 14-3879]
MNIKITATCGDKSVSVECKRPSWESVRKAYREINEIGKGLDDYAKAELRYNLLGGKIQKAFKNEKTSYVNTCAVRVSYALNYGGMPIEKSLLNNAKHNERHKTILQNIKNMAEKYNRIDKNNNYYITNSIDMETFLWIKWGTPEFLQKNITDKFDNEVALEKLKQLNKQGIITMRISFIDANGHTTLWDKDNFVDSTNYLTTYMIDDYGKTHYNPIVTEIHFWELIGGLK